MAGKLVSTFRKYLARAKAGKPKPGLLERRAASGVLLESVQKRLTVLEKGTVAERREAASKLYYEWAGLGRKDTEKVLQTLRKLVLREKDISIEAVLNETINHIIKKLKPKA